MSENAEERFKAQGIPIDWYNDNRKMQEFHRFMNNFGRAGYSNSKVFKIMTGKTYEDFATVDKAIDAFLKAINGLMDKALYGYDPYND